MHPSRSSSACSLPMRDDNTLCIPLLLCAKSLSCHAAWKHQKPTLPCLLHSQAGIMAMLNNPKLHKDSAVETCACCSCDEGQRSLGSHCSSFGVF